MVASPSLFDGLGDALNFEKLVIPEHEEWNWDAIVLAYSRTKLTVISDRLPALAGVARRHYGLMKDQYLAGMWWHRLIEQLDWRVADRVNFERPEWRAPTWSWASVEGRVLPSPLQKRRNFLKGGIFSRVLDAATIPSGPDVFGAVSGGYLTLACSSLVPGVLCASASLNETPSTLGEYARFSLMVANVGSESHLIAYIISATKEMPLYTWFRYETAPKPWSLGLPKGLASTERSSLAWCSNVWRALWVYSTV
ncbi:hypothetical protein PG987_001074 [Apiospora arundinis]